MSRRCGAAALVVLLCGAGACATQAAGDGHEDGQEVVVVAAFYPLAWLAEELGGDAVTVATLTPDGVEPHDLAVDARGAEALGSADLVLYLGAGFQPDVQAAVGQIDPDDGPVTVDLLDAVAPLPAPRDLGKEPLAGGHDPHVWLDPLRMRAMAERTADALRAAAPDRAEVVSANLDGLLDDLDSLHAVLDEALADCDRDVIVTSHAAFGYLADRYGLHQLAIAGLSPDAEPDPRTLTEISAAAREAGVTTVFFEEALPPDLARTVAAEIEAGIALLGALEFDPESAFGAGEDYLTVMTANAAALSEGLSCR